MEISNAAVGANRACRLRIVDSRVHRACFVRHHFQTGAVGPLADLTNERPFREQRSQRSHVIYFSRQPFSWLSFLFEVVKRKNGMSCFAHTLASFNVTWARFFSLDLGAVTLFLFGSPPAVNVKMRKGDESSLVERGCSADREGRSCCSFFFHKPFEVVEIAAQRSGKHYGFDDGTNFHSHSCGAVVERVEKHDTDAKMIGHRLPCDPAVRNAHDYLDLACHFFAIDDRRA